MGSSGQEGTAGVARRGSTGEHTWPVPSMVNRDKTGAQREIPGWRDSGREGSVNWGTDWVAQQPLPALWSLQPILQVQPKVFVPAHRPAPQTHQPGRSSRA